MRVYRTIGHLVFTNLDSKGRDDIKKTYSVILLIFCKCMSHLPVGVLKFKCNFCDFDFVICHTRNHYFVNKYSKYYQPKGPK